MAGIQGMASPKDVQPIAQNVPQPMPQAAPAPNMPSEPQQDSRPSLDAIFADTQTPAPEANARPSLDAIFSGEQTQESQGSFLGRLASDVGSLVSGAADFIKPVTDPLVYAAKEVANTEHPLTLAIPGVLQGKIATGFHKGMETPTVGDVLNLKLPENIAKGATLIIPAPTMNTLSPELQDMAAEQLMPKEGQQPYKTQVTPGGLLDLAVAIQGPETVIKGVEKAAVVTKLVGKAAGQLAESSKTITNIGRAKAESAPIQAAEETVNALTGDLEQLAKAEQVLPLTKAALDPSDPAKMKQAIEVANNKDYATFMDHTGEALAKTVTEHIPQAFANMAEDGVASSDDIVKTLQNARKAKGSVIGELKTQAIKEAGNTALEAPEFSKTFNKLQDMLTTTDPTTKLVISNEKQAEELTAFMDKLQEDLFNNPKGMTLDKWEEWYQKLSDKAEQAFKANKETKYAYSSMRKALSFDQNGMLAEALKDANPEAAAKFAKGKSDFSSIMRSYEKVGNLISNNEIASDALLKQTFFSSAPKAVDRTNAVLNVLGIENPRMVADLRGKAVNYMINEAKVPVSPKNPLGIDFTKLASQIKNLKGSGGLKDTNMLNVLTGNTKASDALLRMADIMEKFDTVYKGKQVPLNEGLIGRLFFYGDQASLTKPSTWAKPLISTFKRNAAIKGAFEGMDLNKVIAVYPPSERAEALVRLKKLIAE